MKETTLVHIIKDGCVLMLHRVSKKDDINHGKWIGVGGKFEKGETPEECMRREVREETGLRVDRYRYCGIVTFVSDDDDMEYMHLFTVTGFHDAYGHRIEPDKTSVREQRKDSSSEIKLKICDEGTLEWLPREKLTHIPHWAGDRIFLPLILDAEIPFFSMKLVYQKGELVQAALNEHNCLVTDRLILRPWLTEDAPALYHWAKSPEIGPRAGWNPLKDEDESRRVIRDVLTRPEIYAIVPRDSAEPVGSVGLQNFRLVDGSGSMISFFDERQSENPLCCTCPETEGSNDDIQKEFFLGAEGYSDAEQNEPFSESEEEDVLMNHAEKIRAGKECLEGSIVNEGDSGEWRVEAALGYWLAEPFQHQGIMTEAVEALLAHAQRDLGIRRVWADYYEGNDKSCNVMKRLGLHFHHVEKDRYLEALKERRTAIVYVKDI